MRESTDEDAQQEFASTLDRLVKVHHYLKIFLNTNFPQPWDTPATVANLLWANFNACIDANRAPFVLALDSTRLRPLPDGVLANGLAQFLEEVAL